MQVDLKVKVEVILSQLKVDYIGSVNFSSLTGELLSNITEDQIETKKMETQTEILKFLHNFQATMEKQLGDTKESIDKNNKMIDRRLNKIETEVSKVNDKIDVTDNKIEDVNTRMEDRLRKIEEQMKHSTDLGSSRGELKELEECFTSQSAGYKTRGQSSQRTKDLQDKQRDKVQEVTEVILQEPTGIFRSSWARGIQQELSRAAEESKMKNTNRRVDKEIVETRSWEAAPVPTPPLGGGGGVSEQRLNDDKCQDEDDLVPDCWEERQFNLSRKQTSMKTRKPVQITSWFGSDSTSEEEEIEETVGEWSNIDRKKRSQDRRQKTAIRRQKQKQEVSLKAAHMASLGPISIDSVRYFQNKKVNFEEAKVKAVEEFLKYKLDYSEDELKEVEIKETRLSTKGDKIINIAMGTVEMIRELYIHKAEVGDDKITVRCYIPPNYHERFMYLNGICTEMRQEDQSLKTQIRFGKKDIEIFTKRKGEEEGYRKVNLVEFTDISKIPEFNHRIKWRRYVDKPPRQRHGQLDRQRCRPSTQAQYGTGRSTQPEVPPTRKDPLALPITRANSNSTNSDSKKPRLEASSSEEEEDEEDEETGDISDMETADETTTQKE